ncbi:LysR family transcriptional regulator [Streptomyces samsunensis]|uniref:HTH lysR-type domain-containing protein n=1 Tax=Streptomyces malaysiensis TaxID=92644 RepID=A0A2J7YQJ9_STRMQ|nr:MULTISPECIES: LysR substrate-binding domain-containing protein [Streptomyces]AUA08676.1 HTH-type transcriptional regulator CysL [Streptomyces sp. M56]MCD9586953.1 LysR substrate-binding domain-containing protein [Streptomyces sp. 8ZJF_21]MCM3808426.1 LysR substrate-binding domain-containing protein [Streptomyces sp. DR7-3]MYX62446.1 LysR family transcriptional regulator [Streptomyces sp. SID8382]NUH44042.1 LysR family transcriptional regulator [Streptomyces samsunensis]
MDTRRLGYFVRVVDIGNITRAADSLHITQSALSQHISALENDFKSRLLERTGRGVEVTASGRSLYRYAQGIIRLEKAARIDLRAGGDTPAGLVTVGLASYSMAPGLAVPLLRAVRERYPNIQLQLIQNLTVVMSQAVLLGQVDMALIYDPGYVRGVVFEHIREEEFHLITSARTPPVSSRGDTVTLKEASRLDFLMPSELHTVRRITEAAFHAAGLHCSVVAEVEPDSVLRDAVVNGLGATVLPLSAARAHFAPDEVRVYRFADSRLYTAMSLCTCEVQPLSHAAALVADLVRTLVPAPAAPGRKPA